MRWIFAAAGLLLIAIVFQLGTLAYAMYALLALIGVSRYLAFRWSESISAKRKCDRTTAEIGDTVAIMVEVRNQGRLPIAWLLMEDLLPRQDLAHDPPNLQVEGQRMRLAMLGAGQLTTVFYQIKCNKRGYYQLGPLVMETGDLFGLHRRFRVDSTPHFLLVYPKVLPLEGFELASKRPVGEIRMSYRLFEDPTRIAGVRRYEAGDPLSRVHWRATARTGQLHSKIYEPSTVAGVTLLLDFHRANYSRKHEPFRSELAITAAASIANAVYQMGQQTGLVTNARDAADRIRQEGWDYDIRDRKTARAAASMHETSTRLQPVVVPTQRGPEQLVRILETLARAEKTDGLDLVELIAEAQGRIPRDATVVVFVASISTEAAIALGLLKRQGYAVEAVVCEYDEFEFASTAANLLAQGIAVHQLRDEVSIRTICRNVMFR